MTRTTAVQTRSNATLWLVLGILGAVAVTYTYTGPKIAELKEVRVTALARAADTQALQSQQAEAESLWQRLEVSQESLQTLDIAVPATPSVDEFMRSLEALASASGVVLTSVQPGQGDNAVSVSATLRGSYDGIHLFLEHLGNSKRPVQVRELALNATADADGVSLLTATLRLEPATAATSQAATNNSGGTK